MRVRQTPTTVWASLAALVTYVVMVVFTAVSGLPTAVQMLAAVAAFVLVLMAKHVDRLQRRIDALERREP